MISTTLRRALTGTVVTVMAGTVSVGHAAGSPQVDHGIDTVVGTVADAEYLLGDGLLGLAPSIVDDLVGDQAFAETVSSDLRSGDPFVVDATLDAIAARTDTEPVNTDSAMVGNGTVAVVISFGVAVVISDSTELQMAGDGIVITGNSRQVIDLARTGVSYPIRPHAIELVNTAGLEREQAVSHIVEMLDRT